MEHVVGIVTGTVWRSLLWEPMLSDNDDASMLAVETGDVYDGVMMESEYEGAVERVSAR